MEELQHLGTKSSRIRSELGHPVIDSDGHLLEPLPMFADFVRDHGRSDIVDSTPLLTRGEAYRRARLEATVEERRRKRILPLFWSVTADTDYFATVITPAKYYERLPEAGIDFSVLYPTLATNFVHVNEEETRVTLCRLFNEYMAEQYGPYHDRFTVGALIPMHSPAEAIAGMEHAKVLGAKVALIPSYVRRPRPDEQAAFGGTDQPDFFTFDGWLDTYGIDSDHDYDPVWAKAIELGLPLAVHSAGLGFSDRASTSNFMFNQIGHFAAANAALAKSLFFGGVTRRFPSLRVALLEGGVTVAVQTYATLVGNWKKRGAATIGRLNPANIDRARLAALLAESDPRMSRYLPDELVIPFGTSEDGRDDFADAGIQSVEDIRDRFCTNFYWGCGADDPFVALSVDVRINPLGAKVPALMSSDIGHWDVPEFDSPLAEAYELVEHGILDEDAFRDYVFTNAVRCYGSLNPEFFQGTSLEGDARVAEAAVTG